MEALKAIDRQQVLIAGIEAHICVYQTAADLVETGYEVDVVTDPVKAVEGAALVLTMVSFGPDRQSVPAEAFREDATIVAVDYDMCVPASVAKKAALFLTDDREQYLANRTDTQFAGYPEPKAMIGEGIAATLAGAGWRVAVNDIDAGAVIKVVVSDDGIGWHAVPPDQLLYFGSRTGGGHRGGRGPVQPVHLRPAAAGQGDRRRGRGCAAHD